MSFEEDFPKTFIMIRKQDESGVSGIGRVLSGIVFPDGTTVIRWERCGGSTAVYDSYERFEKIHIISHPDNETEIVWFDERVRETITSIRQGNAMKKEFNRALDLLEKRLRL